MNFDRYNNARQYTNLINDPIQGIQIDQERLQMLRRQTTQKKIEIYFHNEIPEHKRLVSYYQRSQCQKWITVDPYLQFDLIYNSIATTLSTEDLKVLHDYINDNLSSSFKSSKSPDEKELEHNQINDKITKIRTISCSLS